MKIGDICRIVKQPANQLVKLVGEVGWIEEIYQEYASVETLKLDGSIAGCGAVPLSCLQLEMDPQWIRAKELRDQIFNKNMEEGLERTRRWQQKLEDVATKNGCSKVQVEQMYDELAKFSQYYR